MTDKATPRPWRWEIHDGSLASIEGPDGAVYHVLSVSPCKECRKDEWEWGNCFTPSLADADLIVAAVNSYSPDKDEKARALVEAGKRLPDEIPTNWLDSILSGPDAVDLSKCDGRQVEALLRAVQDRLRTRARAALRALGETA